MVSVFLVDDSDLFRMRLRGVISRIDGVHVCGEAKDFDAAVSGITRLGPDIVVLDIRMPDGNGLDILRFIRREYPRTTTIVLSNFQSPEYRESCLAEGADHFLIKYKEIEKVFDLITIFSLRQQDPSNILPDGLKS